MSFGETVKRLRKEKGFTQDQLANLLNVTPQAISRWENIVGTNIWNTYWRKKIRNNGYVAVFGRSAEGSMKEALAL